MQAMERMPHVALIVETSKIYGREILLGIGRYLALHGPWSIFTHERGQDDADPTWLARWQGDGIITRSLDFKLCRRAHQHGIPVVSLRHLFDEPEFPTVFPDQRLIGERVAEHFITRGFRHFGYCGVAGNKLWERQRFAAFTGVVSANGGKCAEYKPTYMADAEKNWEREQTAMIAWLKQLPKPVGIMTAHDSQGVQLLDACRRAGIHVPDEVAVASVDNDPVLCELANPPLSSLDQNAQKLGFEAAVLLDRMMRGKKVSSANYFFEPGEVVTRQSSDVVTVKDANVSKAIRFIRENACREISGTTIANAAGQSRRALEKKFRTHTGRTPMEEVNAIRLRRIKQLLTETEFVLAEVAERSGFTYQEYMSRFFKKHTGMSPGEYRKKYGK
ncbi:MAG: DNA-binding transcriptional regulator [Verrucomicrobia bacterium]|nr:DNA-binding transcriptional regulator [Verrucomicrobiota bacterium]